MLPLRRFAQNLGFHLETSPNKSGSGEVPTHLNDASKKGNDAHGRRRRRHRPKSGWTFIRSAAHRPHYPLVIGAADLAAHTADAVTSRPRSHTGRPQLPAHAGRPPNSHLQPEELQQTTNCTTQPVARASGHSWLTACTGLGPCYPDRAQENPDRALCLHSTNPTGTTRAPPRIVNAEAAGRCARSTSWPHSNTITSRN
jgi:hypothetical protein